MQTAVPRNQREIHIKIKARPGNLVASFGMQRQEEKTEEFDIAKLPKIKNLLFSFEYRLRLIRKTKSLGQD